MGAREAVRVSAVDNQDDNKAMTTRAKRVPTRRPLGGDQGGRFAFTCIDVCIEGRTIRGERERCVDGNLSLVADC
jgi:hypothetical protein